MKVFLNIPVPFIAAFAVPIVAETVAPPTDVPPVVGTAVVVNDANQWAVEVTVPKIKWAIIGEERPKREWPKLEVGVEESKLTLSMTYHPATQIAEQAQNRIVDLKGRRLSKTEAIERLGNSTAVLVSVSGAMPNDFYLQLAKPDALIVILGHPHAPAPQLLPQQNR